MHKQTILVTGGGGFIGSHLCELLLSRGNLHALLNLCIYLCGNRTDTDGL